MYGSHLVRCRSFYKKLAFGAAALCQLAAAPRAPLDDGFILLPGGHYMMGSPETERQRDPDEVLHDVTVSSFYVDPYEVTQEDYEAVMGENPSINRGKRLPVDNVTWLEAVCYCNALSESKGLKPAYIIDGEAVSWDRSADGYRLLSEAEWEYAARAGTSTIFNVGSQVHSDVVNFEGHYPYLIEENYVTQRDPTVRTSRYRGGTIEVDKLPPNAFGLYNTHGNVSEWVFDYYGAYDTENADDPAGPLSGSWRVNRGGSYIDFGKHLRSAYRSATNPVDPDPNLGFRICRNAQPLEGTVDTKAPFCIEMPAHPKMLVAFFSYTGNTENAAELLSKDLKADLFRIASAKPYRGNVYEESQKELNENARPKLSGQVSGMENYDVILLGYPTWWATMPMAVHTFLDTYDFKGKIIMPFSSNGGTRFGDSISDLCKSVPGAYVTQGFEFTYSGGSGLEEQLQKWVKANGL